MLINNGIGCVKKGLNPKGFVRENKSPVRVLFLLIVCGIRLSVYFLCCLAICSCHGLQICFTFTTGCVYIHGWFFVVLLILTIFSG